MKLGGGRRGLGSRTGRIKNSVNVDSIEIRSLPVRPAGSGSDGRDGLGETGGESSHNEAPERQSSVRIGKYVVSLH